MSALALKCRELEKDSTPVADLTVECAMCDPDNPRGVPRAKCPSCKGSGQARIEVSTVVGEIHASRLELLTGGKKNRGRDLDD